MVLEQIVVGTCSATAIHDALLPHLLASSHASRRLGPRGGGSDSLGNSCPFDDWADVVGMCVLVVVYALQLALLGNDARIAIANRQRTTGGARIRHEKYK